MILNLRISVSIIVYLLLMFIIFYMKPSYLYKSDGKIKEFGLDSNKTITSLGVISTCVAIFCFYIFLVIDLMYN